MTTSMGNVLISVVFVFMEITGLDLNLSRAEEELGSKDVALKWKRQQYIVRGKEGRKEGRQLRSREQQ